MSGTFIFHCQNTVMSGSNSQISCMKKEITGEITNNENDQLPGNAVEGFKVQNVLKFFWERPLDKKT